MGDPNISVCLSLSALQNVRETAQPPIYKGIVAPGRVCWDGKGPEGLTATFLLLTLRVVPWRKGHADLAMPALLPPALPGLAAPGLHPVLVSKAQRERKIKPLSAAKPSSP